MLARQKLNKVFVAETLIIGVAMVVCNSYSGNVVIVIIVKGNDRQKEIIEREGKYNQV